LLYLAVKLPLPLIATFLIGMAEIFRPHRQNSAKGDLFLRIMLVFWLLPMTLVGVKFLRYTLALIPFVYMISAVGAVTVWRIGLEIVKKLGTIARDNHHTRLRLTRFPSLAFFHSRAAAAVPAVVVILLFVLWPALITLTGLPYPALYTNQLGGGRAGYFFPHDEFYDLGARESIKYIAEHAGPGALVASEIPSVLQYYLEEYGRTDIRTEIISRPGFGLGQDVRVFAEAGMSRPSNQTDTRSGLDGSARDYLLVQPGRIYFENQRIIKVIESTFPIAQSSEYGGATTAKVYRIQ